MSSFDAPNDAPYQIKIEGEQIKLNFERTSDTTGLVTWTLPTSAFGCGDENNSYSYNGIVITLDTKHTTIENRPTDGSVYQDDPTADNNLHAGDKIGTSLVIGALYDDPETTSLEITGLKPNTPYYVQGYAVDAQFRYHQEGVHAYSLKFGNEDNPDQPATQEIKLNDDRGVLGTDGTGLIPGKLYSFNLIINQTTRQIVFDGTNAGTFDHLVAEINKQIKLLENPLSSPVPLNSGRYYWDGSTLYQWDGHENVEQSNTYIEPTDPAILSLNTYWNDTSNDTLYQLTGSPPSWNQSTVIEYHKDPTNLSYNDYWYNGSNVYEWEGTTWCSVQSYIQAKDPSKSSEPSTGTYWYDTNEEILYKWNNRKKDWVEAFAILWDTDPNNLSNQTLWFDLTNDQLKQLDNTGSPTTWNDVNAFIQEEEPQSPAPNAYWFNPTTEQLQQWAGSPLDWVDVDVIVWPDDPRDRESCDLWWNSTTDQLNIWDAVTSSWDTISSSLFLQQSNNPVDDPTISIGSVWLNTQNSLLYRWDGSIWNQVNYIDFSTDPTNPQIGYVWEDTENQLWYEWDGSMWNQFNPIDSDTDPQMIGNGVLWFDTTNDILYERNGSSWIVVPHTTTSLAPQIDTIWFNTSNNTLNRWDGSQWVEATPLAIAELNSDGNLLFSTGSKGSGSTIEFENVDFKEPLKVSVEIQATRHGSDGLSGKPMYAELGIGDDGTVDERRELIHSIRAQLGYPTVDVELTQYQFDTAITAALESYRKRSGYGYRRGFYFLDLVPNRQQYLLTSKEAGYHKIVDVLKMQRFTSAFLSTAHGSGVYGQIVLQHLYNMGTYDLTSFHLVSQYVEQMEHLFATRMVFSWAEQQRNLMIHQAITRPERVLMDTSIERPEQELLRDRWVKSWIERRAMAECYLQLSRIRGKYASLPGAGGGVSLDADHLAQRAEVELQECYNQLEDYIADRPEEFGMETQFLIG